MPHNPLTPCTEIAPTGSSMCSLPSMKKTATQTNTPAIPPISTADGAVTNAHGAVMATNPATVPFANIEGSGLPYLNHMYSIDVIPPAAPASIVFDAVHVVQVRDRKSTRLNSSHLGISYAVFCLKKKKA